MTEEEKYGVIKAPESPTMAKAAELYRGLERRLEGSPMEYLLPGSGIAQVLERKAYGEDPSALEYGLAGLDVADITPIGKMAMFLGPAAKSGVERISKLVKREQEGATPDEIWAEQGSDTKRVFRSSVDGRPRIELDTSEAKLRTDSALSNAHTPVRSFRRFDANPEGIVGKADIEQKGRLIRRGEVVDETQRYHFERPELYRAATKGPLRFDEIIEYPSLIEEYPEIANVRIAGMPPGINAQGMYVPATNTIHLRGGTEESTLSTLLHEAQHWIQDYEGLPFGTSPDDVPKDLKDRSKALQKQFRTAEARIKKFLEPTVKSSMDIRGYNVSDELVEKETEYTADMLLSLFKGYRKNKLPDEKFSDYVVRQDYGRLPESVTNAPSAVRGPSELLLDSLEPFIQRYDDLEEQAVRLEYQLRRADEESLKKYSAVAGEVEARNVEGRLADPTIRRLNPNETMDTPLDEIYYAEIIPPTSEVFDDFGNMIKPKKMAEGGGVSGAFNKVKGMVERWYARKLGMDDDAITWATQIGEKYGKDQQLDGQGDAARHLALGWLASTTADPQKAFEAIQSREDYGLDHLAEFFNEGHRGRRMDIYNNELGFNLGAANREEAEAKIRELIENQQAEYMTPEESRAMRGYAQGGGVNSLAPMIKARFNTPSKHRGVGGFAKYIGRRA